MSDEYTYATALKPGDIIRHQGLHALCGSWTTIVLDVVVTDEGVSTVQAPYAVPDAVTYPLQAMPDIVGHVDDHPWLDHAKASGLGHWQDERTQATHSEEA